MSSITETQFNTRWYCSLLPKDLDSTNGATQCARPRSLLRSAKMRVWTDLITPREEFELTTKCLAPLHKFLRRVVCVSFSFSLSSLLQVFHNCLTLDLKDQVLSLKYSAKCLKWAQTVKVALNSLRVCLLSWSINFLPYHLMIKQRYRVNAQTPFNVFDPNLNRTVYQNKSASLA